MSFLITIYRRIIIIIFWFLFCITAFIYVLLKPRNKNNMYSLAQIMKHFVYFIYNIKVHNELEQKDLPPIAVYISNHQNNIDIFVLSQIFQPNSVTIGKKSLLFIPIFGLMYYLAGNLFINRESAHKSYKTLQIASKEINEKKLSLWLFPEGTRSKGKYTLGKFKSGAFTLAINNQIPIIPVCICDLTSLNFSNLKTKNIYTKIMKPISTKGMTRKDIKKLKEECNKLMLNAINELNKKYKENEYQDIKPTNEKPNILSEEEYKQKYTNL